MRSVIGGDGHCERRLTRKEYKGKLGHDRNSVCLDFDGG